MSDTLVTENIKLVPFVVIKYFRPQSDFSDFEDLCSVGNIGLVRAAKTFDPTKRITFSTYATKCICNEILRSIRENTRKKRTASEGFLYLDQTYMDGEIEASFHQVISSKDTDIEDIENKMDVEYLLSVLTDKEKQLLTWYFGLNGVRPMNHREIARRMGCTSGNVSQLIRKALKYLRTRMEVAS
jgi:RNA polymerase sporulation-specific sigma factor